MKTGIDVSAWQGVVDWQKAAAHGASFAFIKASQQLFSDRCFAANWRGAREAGLPRGAYHYLTWDASALSQAVFFSRLLKEDPGELPPTADFEENAGCPAGAAGYLRVFIEEVENQLGRPCMVYTSPGFWRSHGSSDDFFGQRPLWLAHWGVEQPLTPAPWAEYAFWQFTSKGDGQAYGVSSRSVDCSYAGSGEAWLPVSQPKEVVEIQPAEQLARLWAAHPGLH